MGDKGICRRTKLFRTPLWCRSPWAPGGVPLSGPGPVPVAGAHAGAHGCRVKGSSQRGRIGWLSGPRGWCQLTCHGTGQKICSHRARRARPHCGNERFCRGPRTRSGAAGPGSVTARVSRRRVTSRRSWPPRTRSFSCTGWGPVTAVLVTVMGATVLLMETLVGSPQTRPVGTWARRRMEAPKVPLPWLGVI